MLRNACLCHFNLSASLMWNHVSISLHDSTNMELQILFYHNKLQTLILWHFIAYCQVGYSCMNRLKQSWFWSMMVQIPRRPLFKVNLEVSNEQLSSYIFILSFFLTCGICLTNYYPLHFNWYEFFSKKVDGYVFQLRLQLNVL